MHLEPEAVPQPEVPEKVKGQHGGVRANSGAHKKEPTKNVIFRIPIRLDAIFKERVRELIVELKKANPEL